ncbi:MAG: AAA family ATPase [Acidobacteria bacterium]|nr:AAA family ATPase [Acidobacteriota bacterium]
MAKIVSLINMKGGVGKSTLTVNLAWHFAAYRNWLKKVLVVDLDPQFNASQYLLGVEGYKQIIDEGRPTVWDIFEAHTKIPGAKVRTVDPKDTVKNVTTIQGGGRLDLIPSRLELALTLKTSGTKERLLEPALKKLDGKYDLILIDCAPTESILSTAAYLSSDYILVPVKPDYLSTIGLPLLINSIEEFKQEYPTYKVDLAGIIFNATTDYSPEESISKREVKELAKKYNWYVFKTELAYSRSYNVTVPCICPRIL